MTELARLLDEYLILQEHVDKLTEELDSIKARLRDLDAGQYETGDGHILLVADPPRQFDLEAAVELLPLATKAACMTYDAAKIKRHLSPAQLDLVMRDGTGKRRVYVK